MLMGLLYQQAQERPEHPALVYRDEAIVFAELVERIERLASGLRQRGIGPGDAVGLVLRDDPWFVVGFHALTALGAMVVPVNPAFKQAELEFCFRSAGVTAVISDERTAGVCERIAAGLDGDGPADQTSSAHGQADTLDALLEEGSAGRLGPRSPEETLRLPVLLRLDRPPEARAADPRAVRRRGRDVQVAGHRPRGQDLQRVPLFHTWGMGACLFGSAASGATLVILEDPHPFLLQAPRARSS